MRPGDGYSIVEIGAQRVEGRMVVGEFQTLVKSDGAVEADAMRIHGISEVELLANGQAPDVVFPAFLKFIGSDPLVAHNVGFDLAFLNEHHKRLGLPPIANATVDTVAVARNLLVLASYSLEAVARFLRVPQPTAHRALADVETLRGVLFALADRP